MPRFGAGNHESMSRRRGGPRRAGSEAQRGGVAARAQSGWGRGWGGREFGCGRTQRRCAGVIDAAGLAHGEMGEDCLDDRASSMTERHFRGVSMHAMTRNVRPHTPQCSTSMWKTRLSRCIQLMGAGRKDNTHWRMGCSSSTCSTRRAAVSAIRRAQQLWTESPALATERHQLLMPAGIGLHAQESVFEAPAFQVRLELVVDELGGVRLLRLRAVAETAESARRQGRGGGSAPGGDVRTWVRRRAEPEPCWWPPFVRGQGCGAQDADRLRSGDRELRAKRCRTQSRRSCARHSRTVDARYE